MKLFQKIILTIGLVCGLSFCFAPTAFGASLFDTSCSGSSSVLCKDKTSLPSLFEKIINTLLFILGAVAVLMIIVGGFHYVISLGKPDAVEQAKNTIMYSVVGLVVALLAYAIVHFVIQKIK